MQKLVISLLLFCSIFLLTGCFELLEVINLNEKGGGSSKLVLNMSMSKSLLEEFMQKDSVQGVKVPTPKSLIDGLEYAKVVLQETDGIHNADYKVNLENFILTFTADFDSVQALNNAYNLLLQKKPILKNLFTYSFDNRQYSRKINETVLLKMKTYYNMLILYGIQDAKFTTIVRSEKQMDSASSPAKVSTTGKSLFEVKTIQQLIDKQFTQLTIRFQ